jgi:hypothetical protein
MSIAFAAVAYRAIRDRIRAQDPTIDETTLADTVDGLTDLHEVVAAVIRSALRDEALALGLKTLLEDMQARLDQLQTRATKRRQMAKDVMTELNLHKLTAPDFTVSVRAGVPSLLLIDETAIPEEFWQPSAPRLDREALTNKLKQGAIIPGASLSPPKTILSVRTRS